MRKGVSVVEKQATSKDDPTTDEDRIKAYILSLLHVQIKGADHHPTSVSAAIVLPPPSPTPPQVTNSLLHQILKKAK